MSRLLQLAAAVSKAIGGAVAAGSGAYLTAIADGEVTQNEWAFILGSVIIGAVLVFYSPKNKPLPA